MKRWEKKEAVRKLRREGLSYQEIREHIKVAKSTVSQWCKDIELTPEQKARLGAKYDIQLRGAKAVQVKRRAEVEQIKILAKTELRPLTNYEFKIAGIMLYWAEGNKTERAGITNSDSELIRFMMRWFREVCQVPEDKFKVHLHIHSGQDEDQIKQFWSEVTGIPLAQFGKSHIKKEGTGHKKNILYNGTIKIDIYNKNLLYRILGWVESFYSGGRAASSIW